MIRVAAVDIGTNSTRLLVGDVDGATIHDVARRSTVTRLGEGVDSRRMLQPDAIARVHRALAEYRGEIDRRGAERTLAVATSAVRDARNGAAFAESVASRHGFVTHILSGNEEAELTRRGVGALAGGILVLDVGGGSTELILAGRHESLDVGSVRLTERFLHTDPPRPEELSRAAELVRSVLPALEVTGAIGVAGTVAQLRDRVGGLTVIAIEQELGRLASMPLGDRRRVERMNPDRAPVIVGGALIVLEVLRRYRLDRLAFSIRDLLDGVALAAAAPTSHAFTVDRP